MSYSTAIFQILKAIETLDDSVDFNLFKVFDISKINISEKLLIKY